jgi:Protein of unknown function (DUF2510)
MPTQVGLPSHRDLGAPELLIVLVVFGAPLAIVIAVVMGASRRRQSSPTAWTGPGPTTPPGWHPDPAGRHELRWGDGTRWTESVSDSGVPGTDPL